MKRVIFTILICILGTQANAQDDLMSILEDNESSGSDFTTATFKSTRLINGHSIEMRPGGVLEFVISHRFGTLNGGINELYGLDESQIRIALEYGLSDKINVGFGRSSFLKTLDGFVKYKILRQGTGSGTAPISLVGLGSSTIKTGPTAFTVPDRAGNKFTHRMAYTFQLLAARKVNSNFSVQLMPTLVHQNIVSQKVQKNDILALGIGGRHKLTQRLAFNVEYYHQLTEHIGTENTLAVGLDIETGGHVFQLHFTNTRAMNNKGFITETTGNWGDGDIHFGFNVSRVFNVRTPK
jgi:hypothetical protein